MTHYKHSYESDNKLLEWLLFISLLTQGLEVRLVLKHHKNKIKKNYRVEFEDAFVSIFRFCSTEIERHLQPADSKDIKMRDYEFISCYKR